ncbi:MAG: hypothetical protein P8X55_16405, partial [Desulfosarcinaceae bacterium]
MQGKWIKHAARILVVLVLLGGGLCAAQEGASLEESQSPTLARAVMCESITGYEPANVAVVFSINS